MRTEVSLPPKLVPLFAKQGLRYRLSKGGRGSGKTRTFAKMTAIIAYMAAKAGKTGVILCAREFQNSIDDSSFAEVRSAIASEPWLAEYFDIGRNYIRTICGRVEYVFCGLRHNIDSIKSKAKIILCWVDEAEPVTEEAWTKLIPTVREDDSEIWVTWNPETEGSATDKRFGNPSRDDAMLVEMNWRDNPWFPAVLDAERLADMHERPSQYDHIWEGAYKTEFEGAYFTDQLRDAKQQGRITFVPYDPLMAVYAVFDIGGTGAKADAAAIWMMQKVGQRTNFIDYYEARSQPLSVHVQWLRSNGYGNAVCELPHDGAHGDTVFDVTYEGALRAAGFIVNVTGNQGAGAAKQRIEVARREFRNIWFDKDKCAGGLKAIAAYHEKIDERRNIGLGPHHDWSSHGADAFGLACIVAASKIVSGDVSFDMSQFLRNRV